jgi:DNA end-binding protein Ku
MPARAISTQTISFGLVSIPVKLFSANESAAGVSFNLLHAKCRSRLKQQYVCPKDEEIVPRDQMVKGYEFAKDQYVVFSEEELKALSMEGTRAIEIAEFVPVAQVDPIYFDNAYYLGPDKGGEKAYRLLRDAMHKTGRGAIARWVTRGRQYLVLLRAASGGIVMQQLRYAAEVRPMSEIPIQDAVIKDAELALATQIIDQLATEAFDPSKYQDEVAGQVHALIEQKVSGQEIVAAPEAPRGQIIDLMEALKASLAKKPAPAGEAAEERKPAQRAPRKAAADAPARRKAQG